MSQRKEVMLLPPPGSSCIGRDSELTVVSEPGRIVRFEREDLPFTLLLKPEVNNIAWSQVILWM